MLCYTSEPVTEAVTVSGWATLELHACSDGDDTDWHVKLTDVTPDGRSLRVTQGCLRAACRDSLEEPSPLVPGQTYRFSVELWPDASRVPARSPHPADGDQQRLPLVRAQREPVRPTALGGAAAGRGEHGAARRRDASRLVLPVEAGAPAQS